MSGKSEKVAAALVIGLVVFVGAYSYYSRGAPSGVKGCNTPRGYVLITAGTSGFNDSANHARPWPVVTSPRGETVSIFVCNTDPVSSHGFAIDRYLVSGIVLGPGEAFRVSFVADQAGNFTIFCNIFCPVHAFMIGRLRVTA